MSEEWADKTWGELATLEYGKGLREYDSTHPIYPVFGTNGQIGWHSSPLWGKAGIVIGRKGAYRGVHYSPKPFFVIDTAFYIKPIENFDLLWAYYQLKDFDINKIDSGSAIPSTSREAFYAIPVSLPPITVQRKIAAILSAYDDLIENNTRRIQILEEMAQMLYREWFMHFRYPGHEKNRMVDSAMGLIPEGWQLRGLGEIAQEVRRSVDINKLVPETPYVGLEHIPRKSIALHDWGQAKDVQSTKLRFDKGDILFGKIRPYFHKVSVAPIAGVCSSDAIVIKAKRPEYYAIALCCVSSDDFIREATQTSQGTKMPRANWDVLIKFPVMIPPQQLLEKFNEFALNSVRSIENLATRNRNLRQTRDLLLPKLISGEVDVAEMDISIEAVA